MTPLEIVSAQTEDDGLWFIATTAPEAYLQLELRRLHAAIEAMESVPWCHIHGKPMLFVSGDMCDSGLTRADFDQKITCEVEDPPQHFKPEALVPE